MSAVASQPQPESQPQPQIHLHVGSLNMNVFALNAAQEIMALAQAQQGQATNPSTSIPNQMDDLRRDVRENDNTRPVNREGDQDQPMEEPQPEAPIPLPVVRHRVIKQSTFVTLPMEIHLKICEWLCVADILALRGTSKGMYRVTKNGSLWLSVIKRLNLLLPILPPSTGHLYGEIKPFMAEYLATRPLFLHENFTYHELAGSLVRQETYDNILDIRILPGSRFIVLLTRNNRDEYYAAVWELKLYKGGVRIPLGRVRLSGKPDLFEAGFGTLYNKLHLIIAIVTPPVQNDTTLQHVTRISAMAVTLELLEDLTDRNQTRDSFNAIREECPQPFAMIYESSITQKVQQIAISDVQHTVLANTVMLAMVCRPRLIMFDYPELRLAGIQKGTSSFLSLGPPEMINPILPTSIWKIKLMPWQNSVLVSQVVIGQDGADLKTVGFQLFPFPTVGENTLAPQCVGVQYLYGVAAINIYFSNLEEGWFSCVRNPDKMLDSPFHSAPAPISIFVLTKGPNGFVHLMMHPTVVPGQVIPVRGGRGYVNKFQYDVPLQLIRRETWTKDDLSFCEILPGAFFSLAYTRPPMSCALDKLGLGVSKPITRVLGYRTIVRQYRLASATTTGAYIRHNTDYVLEEVGSLHSWDRPDALIPGGDEDNNNVSYDDDDDDERRPFYPAALSVPSLDPSVSVDLQKGVIAIAFDESTGVLCYSVDKDSRLRMVDFGGRFRDEIDTAVIQDNGNEEVNPADNVR